MWTLFSPLTARAKLLLLLLLAVPLGSAEGLMGPLCPVAGAPGPTDPDLSSVPEGKLAPVPMLVEGDLWLNAVAVMVLLLLPLLLVL